MIKSVVVSGQSLGYLTFLFRKACYDTVCHRWCCDLPCNDNCGAVFSKDPYRTDIPELISAILSGGASEAAVYATVVGSNLGACLTPIGALAGIMWSSILKEHSLKFGYTDFLRIGVTVALPALLAALGVLTLLF